MRRQRWLAGSMAGMVLITAALGWGCKSSSGSKATPTNTKAPVTATKTHTPVAQTPAATATP
jgi:hypothetical protein